MVRVKENAYEGSDEPKDFEVRGKVGLVVWEFPESGGWEVLIDDDWHILNTDELEEINQTEATQ